MSELTSEERHKKTAGKDSKSILLLKNLENKKSCRRSSFLHWINTFNYIQSRFAICLGTKINLPQLFISKDYTQSISFTMDSVKS